MKDLSRRRVLRGMMNGGAVTVALPLLNCFLNGNGTALASERPMPVRFGTWYWGLGVAKSIFEPKTTGAGYELTEEMAPLKDVKQHINVFTNLTAFRDSYENFCHYSGWVIGKTGVAPATRTDRPGATIDSIIANRIGRTKRFKLLGAISTGDGRATYSYESANTINAPETSPLAMYRRLFGPDFQDPNAPTFTPDPLVMVRKSALSPVLEQISGLKQNLGVEDKARLDEYLTGVRHLEQQFDQQLTKPEPIAACKAPAPLREDGGPGMEVTLVAERGRLMTDLMVMALACDQSRVFNMAWSAQGVTRTGYEKPHHTATHEEPIDPALGYQPNCSWFTRQAFTSFAYLVSALAKQKEGDGSLLDNVFLYGNTDHGYARVHSLDGMPAFTAGRAGGRVKTGLHIDGKGETIARVGYTGLRVMGVDVPSWGERGNQTSKEFGEILV